MHQQVGVTAHITFSADALFSREQLRQLAERSILQIPNYEMFGFRGVTIGCLREEAETYGNKTPLEADTVELMEAAACLWEAVLEVKDQADVHAAFEGIGTAALRGEVIEFAAEVHTAWATAVENDGYDDPFDWDFVPQWISDNLIFEPTGVTRRAKPD
jgi:hypothetical protein